MAILGQFWLIRIQIYQSMHLLYQTVNSEGLKNSNFLFLFELNINFLSNGGQGFIWEAVIQSYTNAWANREQLIAQISRRNEPKYWAEQSERCTV